MIPATPRLENPLPSSTPIAMRVVLAALVVVISYLGWFALWVGPGVGESLAYLFKTPPPPTLLDRAGSYWQWVVCGASVMLVAALLVFSVRLRLLPLVWASSLGVLALASVAKFGFQWTSPVVLVVAGLMAWALRAAYSSSRAD